MVTSVCISKSVWRILLLKVMITGHKMSLCSWLVEPHMKNHLLFISWIKTILALGLFWVEQPFTIQAVFSKMSSKQCKVSQDVTHAWGICELPVPLHYNVCIYSSNQFCNMISSWVIINISCAFQSNNTQTSVSGKHLGKWFNHLRSVILTNDIPVGPHYFAWISELLGWVWCWPTAWFSEHFARLGHASEKRKHLYSYMFEHTTDKQGTL